jgi:hypothetical protein
MNMPPRRQRSHVSRLQRLPMLPQEVDFFRLLQIRCLSIAAGSRPQGLQPFSATGSQENG